VKLEIGAGEHPHPEYQVHADLLPLPDIEVVCRMEVLPFADATFDGLRANDVLEHQSWELLEATLAEWARVLRPEAEVYIQVPDSLRLAQRWVSGDLTTREANYWITGGHAERPAHRGTDAHGTPRWLWNAHHTLFEPTFLKDVLEAAGFCAVSIEWDGGNNLMCWCQRN
jgi:predicted SAM-dependent methyltransferase